MARADSTYVVLEEDFPIAVFTVKHELVTWLKAQGADVAYWKVYRLRDGNPKYYPVELNIKELIG